MYLNTNFFMETPCETDGLIKPCREFEPQISLKKNQVFMEIDGKEVKVRPLEFLENMELGYGLNKLDLFSKDFLVNAIKENCVCFSRVAFTSEIDSKKGYILETVIDTTSSSIVEEMYNKEVQVRSNLYFD